MYRIEVTPGEETVFRTIEELAIGIRNGVITPRARIFHQASQKWLPIALHPHYKKALEMPAASASPAPVTTTTPKPAPSTTPMATELKVAPKAPAPDGLPAPTPSPIVAMQREVLRDLPVLLIPEPAPRPAPMPAPLPWQTPVPRASEPDEIHPTPAPAPRPLHEHARLAPHSFGPPRVAPRPEAHDPAPHRAVVHPPAATAHHSPPRPVAHHPAHHPVAEHAEIQADDALLPRPTARRPQRMGGRLMLFGVAAALVIGTHFALTTTPSASADPAAAAAPADGSEAVEPSPEVVPASVKQPAGDRAEPAPSVSRADPPSVSRADAPRVTTAPAQVVMTPGPAFAGSVPARPGADSVAVAKAAATEEPLPSIAPAPRASELALPDLPPDSVVGTRRTGDTLAMKKILRAINGDQASEASPGR